MKLNFGKETSLEITFINFWYRISVGAVLVTIVALILGAREIAGDASACAFVALIFGMFAEQEKRIQELEKQKG